MIWYEILFFILALIIMLVGIIGIVLPILPGLPLIFGAALLFSIVTGFQYVGAKTIIIFACLTLIGMILDYVATALGVKKMGGSTIGMIGASIGMIVGLLIPGAGIFGFIIGAFIGAVVCELLVGKEARNALKAGFGSFIGFLAGGVLRFVIGVVMVGVFFYQVLF
jgi:uncharacterized protein YqgC (DUF456 family)